MIGKILARILKEKNISTTELAKKTNINIGFLSHIEKGERNPSHTSLKKICKSLDIPYQPLAYTYDKELTDNQKYYKAENHIVYDKIPAIESLASFINCPSYFPNATIAIKITDNSMEPILNKGDFAFIELNSPLDNMDIGIFEINNNIIIRRFIIKKNNLILQANNKNFKEISIPINSKFSIIGKILGTNTGLVL